MRLGNRRRPRLPGRHELRGQLRRQGAPRGREAPSPRQPHRVPLFLAAVALFLLRSQFHAGNRRGRRRRRRGPQAVPLSVRSALVGRVRRVSHSIARTLVFGFYFRRAMNSLLLVPHAMDAPPCAIALFRKVKSRLESSESRSKLLWATLAHK